MKRRRVETSWSWQRAEGFRFQMEERRKRWGEVRLKYRCAWGIAAGVLAFFGGGTLARLGCFSISSIVLLFPLPCFLFLSSRGSLSVAYYCISYIILALEGPGCQTHAVDTTLDGNGKIPRHPAMITVHADAWSGAALEEV